MEKQQNCARLIFALMYTRQQASQIRKKFWTSFGHYMRPVAGAAGEAVNWLNYKTGIRHIHFRMDTGKDNASIAIELKHPDHEVRDLYFNQLLQFKEYLEEAMQEKWQWEKGLQDEDGTIINRVSKSISDVNIFNEADWPAIISFLKLRVIALDRFWIMIKERLG